MAEKVGNVLRGTEAVVSEGREIFYGIIIIVIASVLILSTGVAVRTYADWLTGYLDYIYAVEVLVLGYLAIEQLAKGVGDAATVVAGPGIGKVLRSITRITGYGVLVSILASIFNANTAAALSLGGFMGMVAGFATQQVIGNAVAGVFLALSRPFSIGDRVGILSVKTSGVVEDLGVMYTVLRAGDKKILIPSSKIVGSVIEVYEKNTGGGQ